MKVVRAIRNGWIVPTKPKSQSQSLKVYDIWSGELGSASASATGPGHPMHMPAPKRKLPGHIESYNPPEEYLFTEEEKQEWLNQEPEDRAIDFIPQKFKSLREVPAYSRLTYDQFQRCLDLYLCPRKIRKRVRGLVFLYCFL